MYGDRKGNPRISRGKKDISKVFENPPLDDLVLHEAHNEMIKMLEELTDEKGRVKVDNEVIRKIVNLLDKYGIKDISDLHLETVLNPQFLQIIDKMMIQMKIENKKRFKLTKLHKYLLVTIISHIFLVALGIGGYMLHEKKKDIAYRKILSEKGEIPGSMTFKQFMSECDEMTKRKMNKESDMDPPDDSKFFYVPEHILKEQK